MGRGKTCEEDDGLARNIVAVKQSGSSFSGLSQMTFRLTVGGFYKDPRSTRLFYFNNFHRKKSNPVKMAQASFSGGELISWSPASCGTHLFMSHLRGRSRGGVLVLSQQ